MEDSLVLLLDICKSTLVDIKTEKSFYIYSSSDPKTGQYYPNLNCSLFVTNNSSLEILVGIEYLFIEWSPGCFYRDYLSIITHNNSKPDYFCGKELSKYITTNSSFIEFQFRTDAIMENFGFQLRVSLLKEIESENELCHKNMYITYNKILLTTSEPRKDFIECSGDIISKTTLGLFFNILDLKMSRSPLACDRSYVKFEYYHRQFNKSIEHIFCGSIYSNGPQFLVPSDIVKVSMKFYLSDELVIEYRPIAFPEHVYHILSPVTYLDISGPSEFRLDFRNQSMFAIDFQNSSCLFAFKIHGDIGFGIDIALSEYDASKFHILIEEHFVYDVNIITIRTMKRLEKQKWLTDSFQITLVVKCFICNVENDPINLSMSLRVANLSIKFNLVDKPITALQFSHWMYGQPDKRTIQISQQVQPLDKYSPFYILKIKKLYVLTTSLQDTACNQSGLFIYSSINRVFGPFCHPSDFIPIEQIPFTIVYYYFRRSDIIIRRFRDAILQIELNFYPCQLSYVSSFIFPYFRKCLILYQPLKHQTSIKIAKEFKIFSDEKIALFKLHSRFDLQFTSSIMDIDNKLVLPVFRSPQCYFQITISQSRNEKNLFTLFISINTNCSTIPYDWSIHLELLSRQRIECNSKSEIISGIINMDSSGISKMNQSVGAQICSWHFKRPTSRTTNTQINMLSLEIDVFNLDCEKYSFTMFEKIGTAVHKLNLCEGVKPGDVIHSRSDTDILISLKFNYLMNIITKDNPDFRLDEFVIQVKYVSMDYRPRQLGCEVGWWRFQRNCYKLEQGPKDISWHYAHHVCRSRNAKLLKIDSELEIDFLRNLTMTTWLHEIYSNTSVVIFLGLKNTLDHLKSHLYKEVGNFIFNS